MADPVVEYPYAFTWSREIEDFFEKRNIFLLHPFKIRNIYKEGETLTIKEPIVVEPYSAMAGRRGFTNCGAFSYLHSGLGSSAHVGRYCSIAPHSRLIGNEHPLDRISTHPFACRDYYTSWMERKFGASSEVPPFEGTDRGPLIVGNDVWIGNATLIRRGITIGHGAVVAAGALVVKDVPPFAIVGGSPARIIRYRFDEATIARILGAAWWRYHVRDLQGLDVTDIHGFLDGLERRVEKGDIQEYAPPKIDVAAELHKLLLPRKAVAAAAARRQGGNPAASPATAGAKGPAAKTRPAPDTGANARIIAAITAEGANDFSASDYHARKGDIARLLVGDAARAEGFAVETVRKLAYRVSRDGCDIVFQQNAPGISIASGRITTNKVLTKNLLVRAGIPVPGGRAFADIDAALAYFRTRPVAQVVKPIDGGGGYGVTAGVADEPSFVAAWQKAASRSRRVLVEDLVAGDEVRIITVGGAVAAAVCRVPAHVVGDGAHIVAELVAQKNRERLTNPLLKLYPIKSFDQLELDGRMTSYVPGKGERVRLSTVSNVGMGGESVSVIDHLHPSIIALAERAAGAIPGAILLGLDVLVKDFSSHAADDGNACIIEINSNPAIATPYFAAYGKPASDLPRRLLDSGYRQAREAAQEKADGRTAAILPAPPYRAACGGDSFMRDYSTQMRLIRQAAYARNLIVHAPSAEVTIITDKARSVTFFQGMSNRTPAISRAASNDKEWTKSLLRQAGINTPRGSMFPADGMQEAWSFAQSLKVPVVIKPISGSGGTGIATDISSFAHFEQAWLEAVATKARHILVEEYYTGNDYRVLVVANAIRAATRRIPAHVVGDGIHSIEDLIAIKNQRRKGSPHDGSKPMKLTPMMIRNLSEKNMDAASVPAAGDYLQLHTVANIGSGGESLDVSEHVHPAWAEIAVRTRKAIFDPFHAGFDLIAEDIARSPDEQRWVVIEVNTNPDMGLHHFVTQGTSRDTAGALIEALFPGAAAHRGEERKSVKVVANRQPDNAAAVHRIWRHAHLRSLDGLIRKRPAAGVEAVLSGPANAVDDMIQVFTMGTKAASAGAIQVLPAGGDVRDGFKIAGAP